VYIYTLGGGIERKWNGEGFMEIAWRGRKGES
jgi:hypothetical protein